MIKLLSNQKGFKMLQFANYFSNFLNRCAQRMLKIREHIAVKTVQKEMQRGAFKSPSAGFTLMEILIVVVIIGTLAAFVAPKFFDEPGKARVVSATQQLKGIMTALEMYNLDNHTYPSTEQGLDALVNEPTSEPEAPNYKDGGYMNSIPKDPWGRNYVYLAPGVHGDYDLMSYGADGKKGGEDENADIVSWK